MSHLAVPDPATPEVVLAAIRSGPPLDSTDEERHLNHLVEQFSGDQICRALQTRLDYLDEADGSIVLRLLEAHLDPNLAAKLAQALGRQPDLAPDRAWEALALLDSAGQLDQWPDLVERWDELNDTLDPGEASASLAAQLEEEPDGSWVALEGLGTIDPATRAEIIASLAEAPPGPGLVSFLRLLAYAHDDSTRAAALDALFEPRRDDDHHRRAWAELAADHFDPKVRDRARRHLAIGGHDAAAIESAVNAAPDSPQYPHPELVGSLVTPVDGSGRGTVALASRDRGNWIVVAFTCDIRAGIVAISGHVGPDPALMSQFFAEIAADKASGDVVEDDLELAVALLSATWLRSGPATNPALRFWIERTVGPRSEATPSGGGFDPEDVESESLGSLAGPSWAILEACPSWVDRSPLTYDLAEAIMLRSGDAVPDPRRDAGAFRYLFEHRLIRRWGHYHELLKWMARFWKAAGDDDLAGSALALAWQLADPQNGVPGHPFVIALTTKSLAAAQTDLRAGRDPRKG